MKQNDNGSDDGKSAVTDQQFRALELLVNGKTKTEVANEIGVARETVSRWANNDPNFIATLNDMRLDLHEAHADQMRQMVADAYSVLSEAMGSDFPPHIRVKAALSIIESAKNLKENVGSNDPTDVDYELSHKKLMQKEFSALSLFGGTRGADED